MTEDSLHQDTSILHVYAPNKAVEYVRQTPTELGMLGDKCTKHLSIFNTYPSAGNSN